MSPNKRKMIASDASEDDDSFKRNRRSSLRVNLSYSANLSDSGNGSLGRTQIENDGRGINTLRIDRRLSRSKRESNNGAANDDQAVSSRIKEGIQLKRLTINLEDISAKEQALDTSCRRLKDAILSKTKEIFDKQDELSVKTAKVLGNEVNCPASDTHNRNDHNISVFMPDATTNQRFEDGSPTTCNKRTDIASNRQKEDQYPSIIATPTNGDRRRSTEKIVDKSKLAPKQLFLENDQQKCRIIEDVVLDQNFSVFKQTDENGSSPILSGSNRRLQFLRRRSQLSSRNRLESHNDTHSTTCSDHINIEQPIVCSTFIEDNPIIGGKKDKSLCDKAHNDIDVSQATQHTTNKVISMEITEIHGGIQSSEKCIFSKNGNTNIRSSIKNRKKGISKGEGLEQDANVMCVQSVQNVDSSTDKLSAQGNNAHLNAFGINAKSNQDIASVYIDTVTSARATSIKAVELTTEIHNASQAQKFGRDKKHSEEHCESILSDSSNPIRSSLYVNTSLNVVTGINKVRDSQKSEGRKNITVSRSLEAINNEESIILDNQDESANTTHTSLQMNTSVNSTYKIWHRKSNHLSNKFLIEEKNDKNLTRDHLNTNNRYLPAVKDKETNDVDFLEGINLIERLKNISMQNQIYYKNKSNISETGSKERTDDTKLSSIENVKCRENEYAIKSNNSRDSYSYVEGTPYPISRSVLFKSQLKHKTQNLNKSPTSCNNNINSIDCGKDTEKAKSDVLHPTLVSDKMCMSISKMSISKTTTDDTVIIEDTLSCNPFFTQDKSIVQVPLDKTRLEINERNTVDTQNAENITVRRGRRKLLPLNENSQLCSIAPLEECNDTPKKSAPINRNKKLKKKRPIRKSANYKNDTNNTKRNVAKEQTCSDDDYNMSENKKGKGKKTRKPRKIVSKKIVIKKFVNENVLDISEESRQNKKDKSMEDRNSLNDFVSNRMVPTQWNKYRPKKIVIVTTGLSKGDKSLVRNIVRSLGMAETELNVSKRTTHVVSTGVRTINLLRGIIRGCWLITLEWVLKSLEKNMWLNPEEFEMKHFSKAVLENRKDRQLFGPSYIPELFAACGRIYIERKTTLPCDTLKELIKTAGGHTTENPKFAKITIGTSGLKETWIIDSITTGELQSPKLYQRQ